MGDYRSQARALPWNGKSRIVKVDEQGLIAVEKPAGLMSHPNKKSDFGKALLKADYDEQAQAYRIGKDENGVVALAYLLNRLDSATSGLVLLSLNKAVADSVLAEFEAKRVKKVYAALVFGAPRGGPPIWKDRLSVQRSEGGVRSRVGGNLSAETKLVKVQRLAGPPMLSLLTLMPLTGRTHQLRIQTSKRGCPIVGDRTYGDFQKNRQIMKSKGIKRLCLHCVEVELKYSVAGNKAVRFRAESAHPFKP